MTTLNLNDKQLATLEFLIMTYRMAKIKPEGVADLKARISDLSLIVRVAKGELTPHEATWLRNLIEELGN